MDAKEHLLDRHGRRGGPRPSVCIEKKIEKNPSPFVERRLTHSADLPYWGARGPSPMFQWVSSRRGSRSKYQPRQNNKLAYTFIRRQTAPDQNRHFRFGQLDRAGETRQGQARKTRTCNLPSWRSQRQSAPVEELMCRRLAAGRSPAGCLSNLSVRRRRERSSGLFSPGR